ncbi:MAG: Type secretion system domain protein [Blastococcus sp.]|nr:Type secretion system domain protein [Blastococcus sp.]
MIADLPWPPLLGLTTAVLVWSPARAVALGRLRAVTAVDAAPVSGERAAAPAAVRRRLLAGGVGVAACLLVGGVVGAVVGFGAAVATDRLLRREASGEERTTRAGLVRDLPGACDLLGVCLAAGLPVGGALAAVGEAVPGPLGPELRAVAALYRLGAEPRRAWADVPPELAVLGRALVRAGESGASVAPALRVLAADTRSAARAQVDADVRRAGVWVLAPLGLCFLPAFVCLGVVPLVLGIADGVFG